MQLTHTHHQSNQGIYGKSRRIEGIKDWHNAKAIAAEMVAFMDENNGKFAGNFSSSYAISHCQVCDWSYPLKMFVVDKVMLKGGKDASTNARATLENFFFENRVIFNAEILETPETVTSKVPVRELDTDKDGKEVMRVVMKERNDKNLITVDEGCMSFPHRTAKKMQRYFRIKVRYQYLTLGLPRTFEGWVEGLKAHIIQHEVEHSEGRNMYFK